MLDSFPGLAAAKRRKEALCSSSRLRKEELAGRVSEGQFVPSQHPHFQCRHFADLQRPDANREHPAPRGTFPTSESTSSDEANVLII